MRIIEGNTCVGLWEITKHTKLNQSNIKKLKMLTVTFEGKTLKPNGLILATLSNVKPRYSQYLKVPQELRGTRVSQ